MTDVVAPPRTENPPPTRPALNWVRRNLFRTWWDTLLTLVVGLVVAWAGTGLIRFLLSADFAILRVNLALFMVGRFPRDQMWRPAVALILVGLFFGFMGAMASASAQARAAEAGLPFRPSGWRSFARRFWPALVVVGLMLALTTTLGPTLTVAGTLGAGFGVFYLGRNAPRPVRRFTVPVLALLLFAIYWVLVSGGVGWNGWGGLHLSIFLTVAGILLAFPFGLILAMGRRSSLPAVRWLSVGYIELIRGVPLITLLLLGAFAIGFFLPAGLRPSPVIRILIAITMFEAAYIAEVVRGGLQSVHRGQVEAAQALGLSPWRTMRQVVLPQALRNTIPAMVGQFISLYKDTSLVSIVGLFEILRVAQIATTQQRFLAQGLEVLTLGFAGVLFWIGSYVMSRESRRLEKRLGVGER